MRRNDDTRSVGIDIVRIIAMLGILILHVLGNGGVLNNTDIRLGNYWVSYFLEICAYISVDIFAIMSGWLLWNKKRFTTHRIIDLLSQVVFYGVLITVAFYLLKRDVMQLTGIKDIVSYVIPLYKGSYWYILCYTGLFFLMPYLNTIIRETEQKRMESFLITILIGGSLVTTILNLDFYTLSYGYSTLWLVVCYLLGGYFNKYNTRIFAKREMIVFFIGAISLIGVKVVVCFLLKHETNWLVGYNSPITLIMAISFFLFFSRRAKKVKKSFVAESCGVLSNRAFDVFLIHCHPLVFGKIIAGNFAWIARRNVLLIIPNVIMVVIVIYIVCAIIALLRMGLYKICLIDKLILKIATKADEYVIEKMGY